jgi:sulfite reductase alpha subunit-like flavoprotein
MDVSDDEEILVGVSRPFAFQLPFDDTSPVAMFAGGSGIAPFRSFWQSRAGRTFGKTVLYLGVQSRDKFCYEEELRQYVNEGLMEVHTAFSRDSRGLVYDPYSQDLVEREITPRYIDGLIVEQGQTICDFVMSKKQGGLGGYVCASISGMNELMRCSCTFAAAPASLTRSCQAFEKLSTTTGRLTWSRRNAFLIPLLLNAVSCLMSL